MLRHPILLTTCSLLSLFTLGLLLKYLRIPDALSDEVEADDDEEEEEEQEEEEEEEEQEEEQEVAIEDEFAFTAPTWLEFCRLLLSRSHCKYSAYADSSGRRA